MATIAEQMNPPGGLVQGKPPASPTEYSTLQKSWTDYFANPQVQAGLMQFGVSLMTPMGHLQSGAGHVGAAMADAGGAIGRVGAAQTAEADRQNQLAQQQTENQQRERQITATEQSTAANIEQGKAQTALAERNFGLDEQRLAIYRQQVNQAGAGGASGDKLKNQLINTMFSGMTKARTEWEFNHPDEEFPLEQYINDNLAAINKLVGEGGGAAAPTDEPKAVPTAEGPPEPTADSPPEQNVAWIKHYFTDGQLKTGLQDPSRRAVIVQQIGEPAVVLLEQEYGLKSQMIQQGTPFNHMTPSAVPAPIATPPKPGQRWDPQTKTWINP